MSSGLLVQIGKESPYLANVRKFCLKCVCDFLGRKEQGLFALEVATKVLPYYKEYFNIAYPLPKIDLIAIADFGAGAMENWGLVTYR